MNRSADLERSVIVTKSYVKNVSIDCNHFQVYFPSITTEPLDLRHISTRDLDNQTLTDGLTELELECDSRCKRKDCRQDASLTTVTTEPKDDDLLLIVNSPRAPDISVICEPQMTLISFLVYIGSCFGKF